MTKGKLSVADYISGQVALSDKSQKEIAKELGYENQNMITMFKQGRTKVPLNKIGLFAKTLEVNPVHFLRIAMSEYAPETWGAISDLIGQYTLTDNEHEILNIIRDTAEGVDVLPKNTEEVDELRMLIAKWRDQEKSRAAAAIVSERERLGH